MARIMSRLSITGGKVKSSQTRQVVNRAATAFRLAAQAVSRSNSVQGALFIVELKPVLVRLKPLLPPHTKLLVFVYTLWTTKESYCDKGGDYYEQQYKERVIKNLKQRAKSLSLRHQERERRFGRVVMSWYSRLK